ncbi:MAG: hypothetical protein WC205_03500 [Opitutaceae bacterium]|jgi:uncharacterized protein (TIGR03067 family)
MSLHGHWCPVRAELDGEEAPVLALENMELLLHADTYTVRFAGEIHDHGVFIHTVTTLVLTGKHGAHAGRVIPAIYQLVGNRLRICYGLNGKEPADFTTTTGSCRYLVTYRRDA